MERTKTPKVRRLERTLGVEIRSRANLLPIKSLIYTIAHVKQRLSRMRGGSPRSPMLMKFYSQLKTLELIAKSLDGQDDISAKVLYANIEKSMTTYVNLLYALSDQERKMYITSTASVKLLKSIKPERNLLLIPAIMADKKVKKSDVIEGLSLELYKSPMKALYESCRWGLYIARLERNMAIAKRIPEEELTDMSKAMAKLDSKIKEIERGEIDPDEDERLKREFISDAINFSQRTDLKLADYMSEKVGTKQVNLARISKTIRRQR